MCLSTDEQYSFLFDIFGPGGVQQGGLFGIPFPLLRGASGDYVTSREELDRVISQLMEQHQGNAPPPAPREVIDKLPRVKVTEEQAAEGIDCAVCKDDLNPGEEVAKMPCKHIYHFECVSKWLEAHNVSTESRSFFVEPGYDPLGSAK